MDKDIEKQECFNKPACIYFKYKLNQSGGLNCKNCNSFKPIENTSDYLREREKYEYKS